MSYHIKVLKAELLQRQQRSPRYSLRAFANYLEIDASSLSAILKGLRPYPLKKAQILFDKLNFNEQQRILFFESIGEFKNKQPLDSDKKAEEYITLHESLHGKVIGEWEYFAFLNLLKLDHIEWNHDWFAKRLNITLSRINTVIDNLIVLKLIEKDGDKYVRTHNGFKTTEDQRSIALMQAHIDELDLAADSLLDENLKIDHRDFSSVVIPTDKKKLKAAKKLIRDFRRKMENILESGTKTDVYQLSIQLFPLTKD